MGAGHADSALSARNAEPLRALRADQVLILLELRPGRVLARALCFGRAVAAACALGDCEGLAAARNQMFCTGQPGGDSPAGSSTDSSASTPSAAPVQPAAKATP